MTLTKLIQLRQGVVAMKVFKDQDSGKLLFTLDKDFGSRRVMGPMFAEDELYQLLDLMLDYDEWESGAFHGIPNRRVRNQQIAQADAEIQAEISMAIEAARKQLLFAGQNEEQDVKTPSHAGIEVLPSLPEHGYVYTCVKCGCHVQSVSFLPGGSVMRLCGWCGHVNDIEGLGP